MARFIILNSSIGLDLIVIIVLLGVAALIFLAALIIFLITSRNKNPYFIDRIPSTLSVHFDLSTRSVILFNRKLLNGITTLTLDDYLTLFDNKSREKVEQFLNACLYTPSNEAPERIEVNAVHNKKKQKLYYSILERDNVNREKQLIHCSHYFFNFIPLTHYADLKKETKIRAMFNVAENTIKARFLSGNPTSGASFMLIYETKNFIAKDNNDTLIYYYLINLISKYVNSHRILVKGAGNSLVLHDFKLSRYFNTFKLVSRFKKEFIKFLELNGLEDRIKFTIAIVEHKYFPKDYSKTMKALRQTAHDSLSKSRDFSFYDNQNKGEFYFDQSYKSEIDSIIKNHMLKYKFSPIISLQSFNTLGYLSKVEPISNIFNDISEVKDYAYKLSSGKELFSEISKHLCSKFSNENPGRGDCLLFYSLKAHEIGYANSLLGFIVASRKVEIGLVFNENDLLRNLSADDRFIDSFRRLSSKGYKLGLEVTFKTLELPDELYSIFDFFLFDSAYYQAKFDDIAHSSMTLKRSIEKILRYKKKVVITSVDTWQDVELRIQENLRYVSGSAIAPFSEMILPINKKITDKIKRFKKKG